MVENMRPKRQKRTQIIVILNKIKLVVIPLPISANNTMSVADFNQLQIWYYNDKMTSVFVCHDIYIQILTW